MKRGVILSLFILFLSTSLHSQTIYDPILSSASVEPENPSESDLIYLQFEHDVCTGLPNNQYPTTINIQGNTIQIALTMLVYQQPCPTTPDLNFRLNIGNLKEGVYSFDIKLFDYFQTNTGDFAPGSLVTEIPVGDISVSTSQPVPMLGLSSLIALILGIIITTMLARKLTYESI